MLAAYIYLMIFFGSATIEKQSPLSLTVPHSLPPSMHSSLPEKSELDHSNVSKLFSTSEKKKLTLQYFSVTLGICTANSNIQESSSFSLIFLGLICYLAQTLEDPEELEESSASSHIKPVWFLDSAIGSHTSTHRKESIPGLCSLLDTQKCNRHKQLPGNTPRVQPSCYTTL